MCLIVRLGFAQSLDGQCGAPGVCIALYYEDCPVCDGYVIGCSKALKEDILVKYISWLKSNPGFWPGLLLLHVRRDVEVPFGVPLDDTLV